MKGKIQVVLILLLLIVGIILHFQRDRRYSEGYENGFAIGYQEGYTDGYRQFQIEHFLPPSIVQEKTDEGIKKPKAGLLKKTFK